MNCKVDMLSFEHDVKSLTGVEGGDGNESFLVIVIAATAADSAGGEGDGCQE